MTTEERAELQRRLDGRRLVASISGGKDSAAMSLHLKELGLEHDRVFLDTGHEAPRTYDYLRGELTRALGPITEVVGPWTFETLVLHKGMFPAQTRRFCTQELKVRPMQRHLARIVEETGDDIVNCVGIRAAESEARSKMPEWEWAEGFDCEVWRPLITWTEQDVIDIHRRHGLQPSPMYLEGASRVGCFPCIFARKAEIRWLADTHPERIDWIRDLEVKVAEKALARAERKGEERERPPPTFFQNPLRDENGERLCIPIDRVVEWARTSRGGRQMELFAPEREEGCVRWGMCETLQKDDEE